MLSNDHKTIPGFSRYKFYLDQAGDVFVVNKATSSKVAPLTTVAEITFSLTDDKGKRQSISGEVIKGLLTVPEAVPEKVKKGRRKFTDEEIKGIRQDIKNGVSQKSLAIKFGVDQSTISDIKRVIIYKTINNS